MKSKKHLFLKRDSSSLLTLLFVQMLAMLLYGYLGDYNVTMESILYAESPEFNYTEAAEVLEEVEEEPAAAATAAAGLLSECLENAFNFDLRFLSDASVA